MLTVFISVFCAILIYSVIQIVVPVPTEEILKARIKKIANPGPDDSIQEQVLKDRYDKKSLRDSNRISWISKEFTDAVAMSGIRLTAKEYLYIWICSTIIPVILSSVFLKNLITAIAVSLIGLLLPPLFLSIAKKKRQELFTKQLGEALIIIGNCLKGGFSFQQAMESITSDMLPPISSEFGIAVREMKYGLSLEEALAHMSSRIKNRDFDLFASAVLTSAQVGSNLSEILDSISFTIKDRIRIKQEVRVLTSSGRISGWIIGLLPIFLLMILMIINPAYVSIFFNSQIGMIMLIVSVLLEVTGFLIIKKIADIKY